jgi:predicted Zn finger-like uncharacterized protein
MPINTDCPSCNRKLRVPDELLGKKVKCPTCGTVFQADESSSPLLPASDRGEEPALSSPAEERAPVDQQRDLEKDEEGALGPPGPGSGTKPDKVHSIGVMMLISGILGILVFLGWSGLTCCLWPGGYYSLVMGILAIMKGAQLLGDKANQAPAPKWVAILMIINIINGDIPSLVMGIISLQMLGDPEVEQYFPAKK